MTDLATAKGTAAPSAISSSCAALALFLAFVCAPAAQTEDRAGVIGLLKLPQLLGSEFCKEPPRREVALYAAPDSADIVGWIRADKHSSSDTDCYRVVLNVYRRADGSVRELPTHEYEEEEPRAAVVVEARGRWFKLRLDDGEAWVESDREHYLPLEQLLDLRPAHLTPAWDGRLAATPGGVTLPAPDDPRRRLIGYVVPVLERLQVTLAPGQDAEEIRRGTWIDAFGRPDPGAPVVARFKTDTCDQALRSTSSPPLVPVFARRPGWLQVALRSDEWKDDTRAWIRESPVWRFHAFAADVEREKFEEDVFGPEHSSVRFLRSRTVDGRLWLEVEVMSHTIYESDDPPRVVATGWVPAHTRAGESVVWFYSRD